MAVTVEELLSRYHRHNWQQAGAVADGDTFRQHLRCGGCGEDRTVTIDKRGNTLSDTYPNEPDEAIE